MAIHGSKQTRSRQQSTQPLDVGDAPLQGRLTSTAPLQHNTRSDAQHRKVVHHLPYRQQTRALPTADIRISHRPTPVHVNLPEQEPFCTPHGKIVPVDDELFTKTLKFKLRVLAQELEAIGETERVYLAGIEAPTPLIVDMVDFKRGAVEPEFRLSDWNWQGTA